MKTVLEIPVKSITSSVTSVSHNWTHETLTGAYALQIFCGAEGIDNDVWFDNFELIDNTGVLTFTITATAGHQRINHPGW